MTHVTATTWPGSGKEYVFSETVMNLLGHTCRNIIPRACDYGFAMALTKLGQLRDLVRVHRAVACLIRIV